MEGPKRKDSAKDDSSATRILYSRLTVNESLGSRLHLPADVRHRVKDQKMSREDILHEKEEEWIRSNIKQRIPKCNELKPESDDKTQLCNCGGLIYEHAEASYDLQVGTTPCTTYGTLTFRSKGIPNKFIRMDVDTDMALIKHLLLNVWRVPKPSWIISIIGDEKEQEEKEQEKNGVVPVNADAEAEAVAVADADNEDDANVSGDPAKAVPFQVKLQECLSSRFSGKHAVWITSEGMISNLAEKTGRTVLLCREKNIIPIAMYAWGGFEYKAEVKEGNPIPRVPTQPGHTLPSKYYKFNILTDDGESKTSRYFRSMQHFRIKMEKEMSNPDDTFSCPYVIILYGGWSYVLGAVRKAIEEDIPIIVLKGTGGYADVLASVYEFKEATKKRNFEGSHAKWTGTVIDGVLRQKLNSEINRVMGSAHTEGERLILECLQKRELITVYNLNEDSSHESSLLYKIFEALLKSKTTAEKVRLVDFFMPGTTLRMRRDGKSVLARRHVKTQMLGLLLWQLLKMDEAECVQFILDYRGLDIVQFLQNMEEANTVLLNLVVDKEKVTEVKDAYKCLFNWAIENNKENCAVLFWKKGENLLTTALSASKRLHKKSTVTTSFTEAKKSNEQGIAFTNRAIGLIERCYEKNPIKTEKLMTNQLSINSDVPDLISDKKNRKIFGTDAFKQYFNDLWTGKISDKREGNHGVLCLQKAGSPVIKYVLNGVSYITFLVVFAYTLLFKKERHLGVFEGILLVWWISLAFEELRQLWESNQREETSKQDADPKVTTSTLQAYFGDNYWNILDIFALLFFLIGGILLTVDYLGHTGSSETPLFQAARVFLSLDIMFFTWRILQHLAIFRIMGPLLEMIYQMMKDLFPFLVIMCVFIVSQGLPVHALLYPNRGLTWEAIINIPNNAYWNIYGELGLEEIEALEQQKECSSNPELYENETKNECPSTLGRYAVPFLLGMYMMLMNVLLLNLVIAKFSFTFSRVHEQTKWLAAWQQAKLIMEYYTKPLIPPPLNIPFHILISCWQCLYCKKKASTEEIVLEKRQKQAISSWERAMAEYYLNTVESEIQRSVTSSSDQQTVTRTTVSSSDIPEPAKLTKLVEALNERTMRMELELQKTQKMLENREDSTEIVYSANKE